MKKYSIIFIIALVFLAGFGIFEYLKYNDGKLKIVFCDVGQGDAIYIRTASNLDILIDGGPDKKVLDCLSNNMPFWDRELDAVILTHPHADHFAGLIHVLDGYSVKTFYESEVREDSDIYNLLRLKLAEKNLSANKLTAGGILRDSSNFKLTFLWPRLNRNREIDQNRTNMNLNDISLVGILEFGNFSVLFPGDAEAKVLENIENQISDIDVIKIPHHGSRGGLTKDQMEKLSSDLAIIMVGKNNKFKHPSDEIINLLEANKVKVLRTDIDGEIRLVSDGNTYYIN